MKKILAFLFVLVWSSLLWSWIYFQKQSSLQKEGERVEHLASHLADANIFPLQNQLEPLVSLHGIDKEAGVRGAFILEEGEEKKAPASNLPLLKVEKPILGLDQELLGKAVVYFAPQIPHFYSLWALVFIPPLLGILALYFWQKKMVRQKKKTNFVEAPKPQMPWLKLMSGWLGGELYHFDEAGNILNASVMHEPQHVLDLFPEAGFAQAILGCLEKLEAPQAIGPVKMGTWREENGTKHYFLVDHRACGVALSPRARE